MDIKYEYALSVIDALIHVSSLHPATRSDGAPFRCPSCQDELLPVLGTKTRPHFRHRSHQPCAPEGYLHYLAKHTFCATYLDCVANKKPFHLMYEADEVCDAYEASLGFSCVQEKKRRENLIKYFERAQVEGVWQNFRADVLLSSATHNEVILVEFVHTHAPGEEKVASGLRMIEIPIRGEETIEMLRKPHLDSTKMPMQLHHFQFREIPATNRCGGECQMGVKVLVFIVYTSSKSAIPTVSPREALALQSGIWKPGIVHVKVYGKVEHRGLIRKQYVLAVRQAHFQGIVVKNCFLCKYHGASNGESGVFCKVKKESVQANDAATCEAYRPLGTKAEYEELDRVNRAYQEKQWAREKRRRWSDW